MRKLTVYSKARGIRTLKQGITLNQYREKHPDAIKVHKPRPGTLEDWHSDGGCEAIDGCWVEPDGTCEHGFDSWLLALGWI